MSEKMRQALEITERLLRSFKDKYGSGLATEEVDEIVSACNHAQNAMREIYEPEFFDARIIQRMLREAHDEGFRESLNRSEERIEYTQPYEIYTNVGIEVDSKGMTKPSAQVKITRKLEGQQELGELIHADLSRGVEECMMAIREVLNKSGVK